jgi:hypothetical protein
MRFMILVKGDGPSENLPPKPGMFEAMGKYNQELQDAGVLLALEGLAPSRDGARVTYDGNKASVVDGPFSEAKELVGGFWIIQVRNKEEAVEWARRIPFMHGESVEIRRLTELSDFEGVMTPETLAAEAEMRAAHPGKTN